MRPSTHRMPGASALVFSVLLALSIVLAGCSGDPTAQTPPSLDNAWQRVPSRTDVTLRDVWGSSRADVFAVGDNGTIVHYNGARWVKMTTPTTETLRGVSGSGPDNVYASGDAGTVLHYDGSAWTALDPGTTANLGKVIGYASGAIVVDRSNAGLLHTYDAIFHQWFLDDTYTGVVMNDVAVLPDPASSSQAPALIYFFVGDAGAAFYSESGWQPLQAGTADLVSVLGPNPGNAFVLDADGTLWEFRGTPDGMPVAMAGAPLADAAARAYDDIFLVGAAGRIMRYDRCQLSEVTSGVNDDLLAVWAEPFGDVFAVGAHGTVLRYRKATTELCPDNVYATVGEGTTPTISWYPPCPVSKIMVTSLEGRSFANWFIAADGNLIESGVTFGEVPGCATELRPALTALEAGRMYRLTLVRRDNGSDLAIGFYNFRAGDAAPALMAAAPSAPAAISEGIYVQPLRDVSLPVNGQRVMEFTDPEAWRGVEDFVDRLVIPNTVIVRALVVDPDTGVQKIVQLSDVPVMEIQYYDGTAVYWPRPEQ